MQQYLQNLKIERLNAMQEAMIPNKSGAILYIFSFFLLINQKISLYLPS